MHRVAKWSGKWLWGVAVLSMALLLFAASALWRASQAKEEAGVEVRAKSDLPFRMLPVNRPLPRGVEAFSASPGFRDIVAYKETIAVSARAGLFIYDRNGGLVASY